MSKITNIRLPGLAAQEYSPVELNSILQGVNQIVQQLNSSYTPQATENNQAELDWFTGAAGTVALSTLEDRGTFAYGAFVDYTDQTCSIVETATAITWNTTVYSKHISVGSPTSRIVFAKAGRYRIEFTAQLSSESSNAKTFWFWPRITGTDVTGSTMRITVHDNLEAKTIARTGMFQVNAGDYLEAMWAVDDLDTSLQTYAAEDFCPAVPSVTLTITSVTSEQ